MLEASRDMGAAAKEFVDRGFERQEDPFGNPWAPKKEPDGRPILQGKTGTLRKWRIEYANSEGFKISSRAPYAGVHQRGSGTYGTRGSSYVIRAKRARMLRFTVGGVPVYAKSVNHPGVIARRMEPGNRLPALWSSVFREIYVQKMRNYLR